jgi:hypothetical protein
MSGHIDLYLQRSTFETPLSSAIEQTCVLSLVLPPLGYESFKNNYAHSASGKLSGWSFTTSNPAKRAGPLHESELVATSELTTFVVPYNRCFELLTFPAIYINEDWTYSGQRDI